VATEPSLGTAEDHRAVVLERQPDAPVTFIRFIAIGTVPVVMLKRAGRRAARLRPDGPKGAPLSRGGLRPEYLSTYYLFMTDINTRALDRELKRGSAELLILSLLDARPRHGYDLSKLIATRSRGELKFHLDSLYPLLYRLEERGWIKGAWVEKPDERRRRYYKLTAEGRRVLAQQRKTWDAFVAAVRRVTGAEHA
jgi:PadR family transcriptional regulator, regulatory protein PadR